ncbi:MAG: sugar phosphate isomerase/epimerase [Bacillota bacterium]|nr:sugar phosphate isomerase/epimerase [Bacillota bacterium]
MDKRIGAQLYTLRDFCKTEEDLDTSFKKLKEIGYKIIQVSGVGPIPAKNIKAIADSYSLETVCTHRPFNEFQDNLDFIIDYHHTLGCSLAGLGSMPQEARVDADAFKQFVKQSNEIAKELKKNGLDFGYHNHSFEFAKKDGKYLYEYLVENTDPDCYNFICDTYWYAFAGQNPDEWITKLGSRAMAIHFKDLAIDPKENKIYMAEVMEGNLKWDEIIDACEKAGSKWALVEQDICPGDPFQSMKISYDNLVTKGFC